MSLTMTVLSFIGFKILRAIWRVTAGQAVRWNRNRVRRNVYVYNFVAYINGGIDSPTLNLKFKLKNEGNSSISLVAIRLNAYLKEILAVQINGELDHLPQIVAPKSIKARDIASITITCLIDWQVWALKSPSVTLTQSALAVKTSWGSVEISLEGGATIDYGDRWDDPSALDTRITLNYTNTLQRQLQNLSERLVTVEIALGEMRADSVISKQSDSLPAPSHAPSTPSNESASSNM